MRVSLRVLLVAFLAFSGLTAQTPAPSQPAAKPLRHLEYSFAVHEEGVNEYHYNGINMATGTGAGVGGGAANLGGAGTMFVDVISIAPDGALKVNISEQIEREPRPGQVYTCTVYGSTAVLCPSVPSPSDAQWILLSYLGRQFVDAAPWDANKHWQRKVTNAQYTLVEDFTITDDSNGKKMLIREHKKMDLHNGGYDTQAEDVNIVYDRSMEVPVSIHDEAQDAGSAGSSHASFDFALLHDSFEKAGSP
ncbi:MAG: hypothetical protein JO146_02020 [Candidatus Eremiobacteraeota bacterium]|nr:hypothetical protein [Candidatus Eremiobacteraeota bacterium]